MSKFKFVNIVDIIFISIATLLIIFAWVQFFLKNFILSLIISAVLAISVLMSIRWLRTKKHNRTQADIANKMNFNYFKLAISTMPTLKLATIIKKQLPTAYNAKVNKGDVNFVKNSCLNTFTFCCSNNLTEEMLLDLIKTKTAQNLTIFCNTFNESVLYLTKSFKNINIEIVTLEQLFDIFNNRGIIVDMSNIDLTKNKISIKDVLKLSISRNKSKGYFVSGLVLLFTSLIIPFRLYYVVFSSVLFLLSLICRLKPTPQTNNSIFD